MNSNPGHQFSGCDSSDEEVFWGPVTARELELLWRHRMANKLQEKRSETDPKHENTVSQLPDGQRGENINVTDSLQEVPSLQDLRNSVFDRESKLLEESVEYFNKPSFEIQNTSKDSSSHITENDNKINIKCVKVQSIEEVAADHPNDSLDMKQLKKYNAQDEYSDLTEEKCLLIVDSLKGIAEVNLDSDLSDSKEGKFVESYEKLDGSKTNIDKNVMSSKQENSPEYATDLDQCCSIPIPDEDDNDELSNSIELVDKADQKESYLLENHSESVDDPGIINDSQNNHFNVDEYSSNAVDFDNGHPQNHDLSQSQSLLVDGENVKSECDFSKNAMAVNCDLELGDCKKTVVDTSIVFSSKKEEISPESVNFKTDSADLEKKPITDLRNSTQIDNALNILSEKPQDISLVLGHPLNELNTQSDLNDLNKTEMCSFVPDGEEIKPNFEHDSHLDNIENIPPEHHIVDQQSTNKEDKIECEGSDAICQAQEFFPVNINKDRILQEILLKNEGDDSSEVPLKEGESTDGVPNHSDSESSDDKSFVSLNNDEGTFEPFLDSPIPSIKDQSSGFSSLLKNKENKDPHGPNEIIKSKIPITNLKKPPILKPARLQNAPGSNDAKWVNDLKRKKIPLPRKPDYMVSPAKLGGILKNRNTPSSQIKPPAPVVGVSSPTKSVVHPNLKPKEETPRSKLIPPKKKQFNHISSPISQYIRSSSTIPSAKSLPVFHTPNKIPVPMSNKPSPIQKLAPKFYSSAEKLIVKPGPSSSTENKGTPFLTARVYKHQGRIADGKAPGAINVVTPRAVRKTTNLQETSFATLPQSLKKLDVSVLQEQ